MAGESLIVPLDAKILAPQTAFPLDDAFVEDKEWCCYLHLPLLTNTRHHHRVMRKPTGKHQLNEMFNPPNASDFQM